VKIFVMMPFSEKFAPVRAAIREASTLSGVPCVWSDETQDPGRISEQMVADIRTASGCIADVTGHNPNVSWEVGYAQSLGKPMIILGQSSADLFFDLKDQRSLLYGDTPERLRETLVTPLTIWLRRLAATLLDAPPEGLVGTHGYERTSTALCAKRVSDTVYGFLDLLSRAKHRLFLAAQNHFYLCERADRGEQVRERVHEFLAGDPNRRLDVMMCDPEAEYAVRTWESVTTERYERDLRQATQFFRELVSWLNERPLVAGRLQVRQMPFVPLSVTFVDPEHRNGFLVLTPNAYMVPNLMRPCFVLSRAWNDEIFAQYWGAYNQRYYDPESRTLE